jgi:hypothetical protein
MSPVVGAVYAGNVLLAGLDVDDHTVVFFNMWKKQPTYHRFGDHQRDTPAWEVDATACGRPTWDATRGSNIGQTIPTVHAARIGRACTVCWPQLRGEWQGEDTPDEDVD